MQGLGLSARIRKRKKYKSYKGDVGKKAPNLIQGAFEGAKPFEKCYTDVTAFALPNCSEKLYLSPVLTRIVIGLLGATLTSLRALRTARIRSLRLSTPECAAT